MSKAILPVDDAVRYTRLLLEAGIHFRPGQCLSISAEPFHWPFLNILAEEAYRAGAKFVDVAAPHPRLGKARVDYASTDTLEFVPAHTLARRDMILAGGWSRLAFTGEEDPDLFANVDQSRYAITTKAAGTTNKPLMDACGSGRVPWCVAGLPTPAWAERVFSDTDGNHNARALWDVMKPILRLDKEDPVQAWRDLAQASVMRCRHLDAHDFKSIHLTAPGTDLILGCIPQAHWEGGTLHDHNGNPFIPNLPTEEVFTTPDWRLTEGRAAVTRPVQVMGKPVEQAWFEFQKGRVETFGATNGEEQLAAFFNVDERARYLGEVALVDAESPIFQSGLIFSNILYDENAACHIALGSGYPLIPSPEDTTSDEKLAMGINQSLVHTDFMIGCPEMDITGKTASGKNIAILRQGHFVPPFAN